MGIDSAAAHGAGRGRRKRRAAVISAVAVVAALVAGGMALAGHAHQPPAAPSAAAHVKTVTVTKTDLSDTQTLPGTLGYGSSTPVTGHGSGVVTGLATAGSTVTRGHSLYRADDQPVMLFYGNTPLFRTLSASTTSTTTSPARGGEETGDPSAGGTADGTSAGQDGPPSAAGGDRQSPTSGASPQPDSAQEGQPPTPMHGRDVSTVRANMLALGYDIGPRVTSAGEDVYTPGLAAAVERWQKQAGMRATGTLGPDQIVVLSGPVRVNALQGRLGDPVAEPLMSATSTSRSITVPVQPDNTGGMTPGAEVTVTLPDNSKIPGAITSISQNVQAGAADPDGGSGQPTLDVSVRALHDSDVAKLNSAPVQVTFATSTRHDVLAVPVQALVALREGGYALQRSADHSLVAVTTGLFAGGLVEVSGTGIVAGLRVETS